MGVTIIKGVTGQYTSQSSQAKQAASPASSVSRSSQTLSANSDAAVSLVRGGRPESTERLTLGKAEKVAKGLKEDILANKGQALDAISEDFSYSGARDAFGV